MSNLINKICPIMGNDCFTECAWNMGDLKNGNRCAMEAIAEGADALAFISDSLDNTLAVELTNPEKIGGVE